ncbi:hypothetical protein EJ05DRAFT_496453 [Pseudovirgaria hyperparasitica]|uniref:Fe2OG dioxygenase domain-containing protein n=1 Tax=Pseudovirgaria hyperparasitica TaxID=470096 RepID=A0A6A6WHI7_9PEZI|nr:uncharacterized protein EJ05DRAFT_496453 [Pseudovirgaria hyperparasitica]KAF2761544.1 hypothetical protein EJ05DRAFT_496453 [Pseudovirgaria hyperparasitica]
MFQTQGIYPQTVRQDSFSTSDSHAVAKLSTISHQLDRFTNLPRDLIDSAKISGKVVFDPAKHLNYEAPKKIHLLADLGKSNVGISPNAFSEPFPLFNEEAIRQMRAEVFDEEVLDKFHCQTGSKTGQVRGQCPNHAPFTHAAWTHPTVISLISTIAGIDLVPALDYDIGHTNIVVRADGSENDCTPPGQQITPGKYCESAFGWHKDCYPFVCVLMLSPCTGMSGGETYIRAADGDIMKARGPELGSAVVMQGRYVEHQATAAKGGQERISMVTSFRPRDPHVKDESVMTNVRNISDRKVLFGQFASYRVEILRDRACEEVIRARGESEKEGSYRVEGAREWLRTQKEFIEWTLRELIND